MTRYSVAARYDEEGTPEASRCVTTAPLDDERLALQAADQLAAGATTDVALLVHGQVVELFRWKGEVWFMVEKLNRDHPGWVHVDREYARNVLQMPGANIVEEFRLVMAYTHEGNVDCIQVINRKMAAPMLPEEAPDDGVPPRDHPMAA